MPDTDKADKGPSFLSKLAGFSLSQGLCGLFGTIDVRIAHYDPATDPANPAHNETCLWVFWHEYILAPVAMWRECDVTMLVSQHRDADWLGELAANLGFAQVVRGSTNRGGTEAIRALRKLSNSSGVGITPDGPRGPRREMALGPVYLASRLGLPLVPTGFGYQHPWRLNSWDRFAVPRPFSRARIVMGPKIFLPPKIRRDELENQRLRVENMINQVTETAEQWAEDGYRLEAGQSFVRQPNRSWRRAA